eukprot:s3347_g6.t1
MQVAGHQVEASGSASAEEAPQKQSFKPFFKALKECKSRGDWFKALNVLHQARRQGLELNKVLTTSALASCAGAASAAALRPRLRGAEPRARWRWAVNLLEAMRHAELETNLFAWSACVSACEKSQLSQKDVLSRDLWSLGLQLLAKAASEDCGVNVVPISAAIACCEKTRRCGQWDRAIHLLRQMPKSSVEANVISLGAVLSSCQKSLCWGATLELLGAAKQRGLQPNTIVVNAAISVCQKFQTWEAALELLGPNSSAVSFGAALGAFEPGSWFWSLQLFTCMTQQTLQPMVSTWNSALSSTSAKWRWATEILGRIRSPDALSLASAITAFAAGIKDTTSPEAILAGLQEVHQRLRDLPGDHSGCDAEVLQATGRAGRWHRALKILNDAGEAAKILPMPGFAGFADSGDSWCIGCGSLELAQKLLNQRWTHVGVRRVAEEGLLSAARLVKAFKNLDSALGQEAAGHSSTSKAAPARPRSRTPRRDERPPLHRSLSHLPRPPSPPRGQHRREESDHQRRHSRRQEVEQPRREESEESWDEESEEEEEEQREAPREKTPKKDEVKLEPAAGELSRDDRTPAEPIGPPPRKKEHHRSEGDRPRRSKKKKRKGRTRGGAKHQRHRREINDPLRRSHRPLSGEVVQLASSFRAGLERRA